MPEVDKNERSRTIIEEQDWLQARKGTVFEVEMADGRLKYNVQILDVGRPAPFVDQFFSNEDAARGLLKKVMEQGGNDLESQIPGKRSKKSTQKLEDSKNNG